MNELVFEKLMRQPLTQYNKFEEHCIPEFARIWYPSQMLRMRCAEVIRQKLDERLDLTDFVLVYARSFPVEGAKPIDYTLREIWLADDLRVLAGIHFYGLDPAKPFVDVESQTRFMNNQEIVDCVHRLLDEFRVFSPRAVRIFSPVGFRTLDGIPGFRGDQRIVAGSLAEIINSPRPNVNVDIFLRFPPVDELYELYFDAYVTFFREQPLWRGRLQVESRDSLEKCAQAGGLALARIDGIVAGILAARPGAIGALYGWVMIDQILFADFRSKGLAHALQRVFLEHLDVHTAAVVIGTIDAHNAPSLRTALSVGRRDCGGWVFSDANL